MGKSVVIPNVYAFDFFENDNLIIKLYCGARKDVWGYYLPITTTKGKIMIYYCGDRGGFIQVLIHELSHHYCWTIAKDLLHGECFQKECYRLGGVKRFCSYDRI